MVFFLIRAILNYFYRLIRVTIGLTLLALALHKAIGHWRLLGLKSNDLITVIVRDQIIYYLM